jgi:hypothetical protein
MSCRYPRVRKTTAEKLYVALMMVEEGEFDPAVVERAQSILTETLWDDDVTAARLERNKICDLLGVPAPKMKANSGAVKKEKAKDDLDSYRDLVDRALGGY